MDSQETSSPDKQTAAHLENIGREIDGLRTDIEEFIRRQIEMLDRVAIAVDDASAVHMEAERTVAKIKEVSGQLHRALDDLTVALSDF